MREHAFNHWTSEVDTTVRLAWIVLRRRAKITEDYRAALIPQRETTLRGLRRQQNYILIGVFELLLAKQQEFDALSRLPGKPYATTGWARVDSNARGRRPLARAITRRPNPR